jgi:hypothetical protein
VLSFLKAPRISGKRTAAVYDWIGRANNTDFIGFYTNAFSTRFFNLKRMP